ncbi:hypothetical protein [Aquiflexum gelatinilyticum]|uniref:hypothetical protein n=1 Tax=Aquiflexum gelatinilyticum TaxID=2961943 RepID=UPI00216A2DC9|nr:hypothetical protein [Aquiflexum gelatinilyticum]MCS4432838.1 hypothetical protein [Aquiflexum gelatinilyticum]
MKYHESGTISIKFFVALVGSKYGPNKFIALLREEGFLESDNMPSEEVLFKYMSYETEEYRGGKKKSVIPRIITKTGIPYFSKFLSDRDLLDSKLRKVKKL